MGNLPGSRKFPMNTPFHPTPIFRLDDALGMLEYHASMGLKTPYPIPIDRLIAKVRVLPTYQVPERDDKHGRKALFGDGVVGRLRSSHTFRGSQ